MNIGLIGAGSIARDHAEAIPALSSAATSSELRLAAVVGRLPEPTAAFAAEFGIPLATTDLGRVLADPGIDAVIVCSPTDLHAAQTEQALRAGKHVLCEIPLATSLPATDRLIALAAAADRRLMVCHTQRYLRPLIEARRLVAAGDLHPHAIVSRYLFLRRDTVNWRGKRRGWVDNLIWHHGAHAVDAALWLLGAATVDVVAQVALPGEDLGIPMDLTIAMRTPRDQIATVVMSYNSHIPAHDYLIIGEETTLLFADNELRAPDRILVPATDEPVATGPIARQDAEFFAAIQEGREPAVSGGAVRPAMAALQAVEDALADRVHDLGPAACHPARP